MAKRPGVKHVITGLKKPKVKPKGIHNITLVVFLIIITAAAYGSINSWYSFQDTHTIWEASLGDTSTHVFDMSAGTDVDGTLSWDAGLSQVDFDETEIFPDVITATVQVNINRPQITLPAGIDDGDYILVVGTTEDLASQSCLQGSQLWYVEYGIPSGTASSWACEIWADGTEDSTVAGMDTTFDNEWGVMASYIIRDHSLADSESPEFTQTTSTSGFDSDSPGLTPSGGLNNYLWITMASVTGKGGDATESMSVTTWPTNYDDDHAVADIERGSASNLNRRLTALSTRSLEATTENPGAYDITCTASPCNNDGNEGWAGTTIAIPGSSGFETSGTWRYTTLIPAHEELLNYTITFGNISAPDWMQVSMRLGGLPVFTGERLNTESSPFTEDVNESVDRIDIAMRHPDGDTFGTPHLLGLTIVIDLIDDPEPIWDNTPFQTWIAFLIVMGIFYLGWHRMKDRWSKRKGKRMRGFKEFKLAKLGRRRRK